MKIRLLALALVLMLLSVPALAEDRFSTIEVEGAAEIVHETKYEGTAGLSFWYDDSRFAVLWDTLDDPQGQLFISFLVSDGFASYVTVELPVKTGLYGTAYLEQRPLQDAVPAASLSPIETRMTEEGVTLSLRTAYDDTTCYKYILLQKNGKELQLFATYSLEAAEGLGVRIDHMVSTFGLN